MWRLKSPHFKCSLTCLLTDDKIYHNLRTAVLANYKCSQRRLRSYCTFAQYYHSLRCALLRLLHMGRVKRNCVLPVACITKTYLYNFDPLKPHFYIVKLGFTGVYIIFLISAHRHRLWVLVRTASSRRF